VIDSEPELNDLVDEILQSLWDNTDFRRLLYATYDEQAVEGSLSTDNVEAARMIREKAAEIGSNVQKEKLHTIVKSLNVVLRRYNKSRKARRQTVHGETVPDENNNE
jgi:hypothetical protein